MKKINILYWTFTLLFAAMMIATAIPHVINSDDAVKVMHEALGYPVYIIPFIGVAKVLGAIAIVIPGFSRIKEWAYAGLFFDLAGALYSIIALGAPFSDWGFLLIPIALGALSYYFYHRRIRAKAATVESKMVKTAA